MTIYQIGFPSESVEKQFEKELIKLPRDVIVTVKKAIETLSFSPRPPGKKFRFLSPPVAVGYYLAHYRLRIGNYRILYDIDEYKKRVILLAIRKRAKNTYK